MLSRLWFGLIVTSLASPGYAQDVAFRIDTLALREPHAFTSFLFCNDITTQVNDAFTDNLTMDGDADGVLDLSLVAVFRPLDQAGSGSDLDFGRASCSAPLAGTSCEPDPEVPLSMTAYANDTGDPCLVPNPAYLQGYSPPITESGSPCFSTEPVDVLLSLAGAVIPLQNARLSGTYTGDPATTIVDGVIEGFVSEADADIAIIPPDTPLIGGQPLSSVLPGGTGNCSSDDARNLGPGGVTPGWWMYLNYTASEVVYDDAVAVPGADVANRFQLRAFPNPTRAATQVSFRLDEAGAIDLRVYDSAGRAVRTLGSGSMSRGNHSVDWDGRRDDGASVEPGIYYYRLRATGREQSGKLVLVR
jgi:hypothetical protein